MPGFCASTSYRLARVGFAGAALSLISLTGCPSPQAGSTGRGSLSVPGEGSVRLVTTALENTATARHYKWSVIGERNWTEAKALGGVLSLGKTYPLNSTGQRGGCNIYEADLTAKVQGDRVQWETRLHGSDGTTVTETGTEPLGRKTLADIVQIRQEGNTVPNLPADVVLARVGERDVRFQIDK